MSDEEKFTIVTGAPIGKIIFIGTPTALVWANADGWARSDTGDSTKWTPTGEMDFFQFEDGGSK